MAPTPQLIAVGASHKTASLGLRERLSLPQDHAGRVLSELTATDSVREAVALSTCNRTELHLVAASAAEAERAALGVLERRADLSRSELSESLYLHHGRDAVEHLFSVAAGLDSMIIGEAEVQGQVKRAYELALAAGATGPVSNQLFRDALSAGKRVRTQTAVGRSSVSVAAVAVELAREFLGELASRRVLVIGAGANGELVARALRERGVHAVVVTGRGYDRALGLAQRCGGQAVPFDRLQDELRLADIVVSSTGAPHHILGREQLERLAVERAGRPLVLIDLAVPRDVDPAVRACPEVALHDMDDLQRAVARNMGAREAESVRARELVADDVERFERWREGLDVLPTIRALHARGEELVERVLRENESRWESLSPADAERLAAMAHAVAGRLLHEPTLRLRKSAGDVGAYDYARALRELFALDSPR